MIDINLSPVPICEWHNETDPCGGTKYKITSSHATYFSCVDGAQAWEKLLQQWGPSSKIWRVESI